MITQTDYERCLQGFRIIDCVVRSKDIICFTAQEDYHSADEMDEGPSRSELFHRAIFFFTDKHGQKAWGYRSYSGVEGLLAGAAKQPEDRFIGIDMRGQVAVIGGGTYAMEEPIPRGQAGPGRGAVLKAKTIDGYVHVCTGRRGLARRDGPNQWTSLCSGLPMEEDIDSDAYFDQGFEDFDAFDGREFYCAGGKGDAWYSQDGQWQRIPLPADKEPLTVCCAGDGWAYIGCTDSSIWRGRRGDWQPFEKRRGFFDPIPKFNDMVWFQDRVYCASDYALWEIVGDDCGECPIPDEVKECCGNLSVADGVMLMAGENGAAAFNGREWTILYRAAEFRF